MPPPRRPSARTRILDAADRLFTEHGIRAVGRVEAIVAAADTGQDHALRPHFRSSVGTRNRSRRWCDMAGCGNRAKNRTWRSRQSLVTNKTS